MGAQFFRAAQQPARGQAPSAGSPRAPTRTLAHGQSRRGRASDGCSTRHQTDPFWALPGRVLGDPPGEAQSRHGPADQERPMATALDPVRSLSARSARRVPPPAGLRHRAVPETPTPDRWTRAIVGALGLVLALVMICQCSGSTDAEERSLLGLQPAPLRSAAVAAAVPHRVPQPAASVGPAAATHPVQGSVDARAREPDDPPVGSPGASWSRAAAPTRGRARPLRGSRPRSGPDGPGEGSPPPGPRARRAAGRPLVQPDHRHPPPSRARDPTATARPRRGAAGR